MLERMPADSPKRAQLVEDARKTLTAVIHYQDKDTGLWWQVMEKGGQKGNYLEASASCMFVYSIAKAVRIGRSECGAGMEGDSEPLCEAGWDAERHGEGRWAGRDAVS